MLYKRAMILRIPLGDGWTSKPAEDGVLHVKGVASLSALRIREQPDDPVLWMRHTALKGAPAGTTYTLSPATKLTTAAGWPAIVQEAELVGPSFSERRIVALYAFLDYAAGAVARIGGGDQALRAEILDSLGNATPDWGAQETATLARVFDGVGTIKPWEGPELEKTD